MVSYLLSLLNRKSGIIEGICSFKKESFMIQIDFFINVSYIHTSFRIPVR